MISETILALRSLAPLIYSATILVVLFLVMQSFGFDLSKHIQSTLQRFMIRSKVSRTGV